MIAPVWAIGEGHRLAREALIGRLGLLLIRPYEGCEREVAGLISVYSRLSGDTHALCFDHEKGEVFEGFINRSRNRRLH